MRALMILTLVAALPAVCLAAPVIDEFNSPDLGNDFLNGRWSEAWVGGSQGQVGNALHAGSWDNASLFTQWEMTGAAISAPPTASGSLPPSGDGTITYFTDYSGGTLTLKDNGPWWNPADAPATSYTVNLTACQLATTKYYVGGVEQPTFRTSIYMTGAFQGFPGYVISFLAGSAAPDGFGSSLPSSYPSFVGASEGAWGPVQKITMSITPEPATLTLLALAGLALLRRRR